MSVIINSTTISFHNNTPYFIEIVCEADQDESFHVRHNADVILESTQNDTSWVGQLMHMLYGSKLKRAIVNLKAGKEIVLTVNSKSSLELSYEGKIKSTNEHIAGYLPITSEFQGAELKVAFGCRHGLWYDANGNVAIVGSSKPKKQELVIEAKVEGNHIDEAHPALCQMVKEDV